MTRLLYSSITYDSLVNGPGVRNVLHLQGCTIGCKGCFNTHTWSKSAGKTGSVYKLAFELTKSFTRDSHKVVKPAITISGGEPTEQWEGVKALLYECHKRMGASGLDVLMFTGLTDDQLIDRGILKESFEECHTSPAMISTIVCGPYERDKPSDAYLLGSANQKILTWDNTPLNGDGPRVEVQVSKDGAIVVSGFPNKEVIRSIKQNFTQEK